MRVVLHPGMHKTGTSSIQATLMACRPAKTGLLETNNGNCSGYVGLLFGDNASEDHGFRAAGLTESALKDRRLRWLENLEKELENDHEQFVFSAERMSTLKAHELGRLADFFSRRASSVSVIAYVRPPRAYMASALQQQIKANLTALLPPWPGYRARFEKFDTIFGRENVELRLFDRTKMKLGDVVIDFYDWLGADLEVAKVVSVNEALSLESFALLYLQRAKGNGFVQGFLGAAEKNQKFIDCLSTIGGRKLRLAPELTEPMIARHADDIAWIENRLGQPLNESPVDHPDAVASEDDLFRAAREAGPNLVTLVHLTLQYSKGDDPYDAALLALVETLRNWNYHT